MARISRRSSVTHADIEIAVISEFDHSSVVISERLGDGKEYPLGVEVPLVRIGRIDLVLSHDRRAICDPGVIDIELSVRRVLRVERHSEKTTLIARAARLHYT